MAELSPEIRQRAEALLHTEVWDTLQIMQVPASKVQFIQVERDLPEPPEARDIRIETWKQKLEERLSVLKEANPHLTYQIDMDTDRAGATEHLALFEVMSEGERRPRMWAGTTINLARKGAERINDGFAIPVYPISYTEWIATQNPDYAKVFREKGLPIPYAGIGVCVLITTSDGYIPVTRRGIETPVYPGRLHVPGGGPRPGQSSSEAILEEVVEELGLVTSRHFRPDNLTVLALISDSKFEGSDHPRPELMAHLPVNATFREVEQVQYEVSLQKNQRQEDVWGIVPVSTFRPNLVRTLLYSGFEMCPPTEGGIAHLLFYQMAITEDVESALSNMESIMRRIQSFERVSAYEPPIRRLSTL